MTYFNKLYECTQLLCRSNENVNFSGSHLNKELLQILLKLLRVGGDGHGTDICVGVPRCLSAKISNW